VRNTSPYAEPKQEITLVIIQDLNLNDLSDEGFGIIVGLSAGDLASFRNSRLSNQRSTLS
jgi:hypothetical protein